MEPAPSSEDPQLYSTSRNAPLEDLIPEIRRHILSLLTVETLRALVHASPVYHQQYLYDRKFLLKKCLNTTFYGYRVDACAAFVTSEYSWLQTRTVEKVRQLLRVYAEGLSTPEYSIAGSGDKWKLDDVVSMTAFHLSVVKPFASRFTRWALQHLANETGNKAALLPLRWVEEARVMRALYRMQTYCNLFFRVRFKDYSEVGKPDFELVEILKEYFCLFEPWEVEEIVCIVEYFEKEYFKLLVKTDLTIKLCGWNKLDCGGTLNICTYLKRHLLGLYIPSSGLELLHATFFQDRYYEPIKVSLENPMGGYSFVLDLIAQEPLLTRVQEELRLEQSLIQDDQPDPVPVRPWKEDRTAELNFQGDEVLDVTGEYPPLTWTLVWYDRYSHVFAHPWCNGLRRWGYVMWDKCRIKTTGSETLLGRQIDQLDNGRLN